MGLRQRGSHNIGVENGLEASVDQRLKVNTCMNSSPSIFQFATGYIMITHFVLCYLVRFFKGCLLQILLGPFLNTLTYIGHCRNIYDREAVTRKCSVKKIFLKFLQKSQENTRDGVLFK